MNCVVKLAVAAGIVVLLSAPTGAETEPRAGVHAAAVDVGRELGIAFASHTKLAVSIARVFSDRVDLQASLVLGRGRGFAVHKQSLRAGLVLHPSRRLDVLVAGRFGIASFHLELPARDIVTRSGTMALVTELRYQISDQTELRFAPAVPSGYWNEFWRWSIAAEAGVAYRF